jgi:purine nucleosidase/pyrimidine-specific ribonucleoside hydrolase
MMSQPLDVIVDCDPGHDDAVAILLALGAPQINLLAITTTFGNCSVHDGTRNALRILALAKRSDIPVATGAAGPLSGSTLLGNYVHGVTGLDGPDMPEPDSAPVSMGAVELQAQILRDSASPVTLVATGPMTNVARLIQDHPDLLWQVKEVIFMGGSTERGNHTPTAEFNTFADPEALDVLLTSGVPVRMVGLNLTHQALATPEVVRRMSQMPHRVGQTCAAWMGFFGDSYNRIWEFAAPPVHDPCTIAALIDPNLIEWRDAVVAVELDGRWTRGTTVVDLHDRYPEQSANVSVAMRLDSEGYWDLVLASLDRLGAS